MLQRSVINKQQSWGDRTGGFLKGCNAICLSHEWRKLSWAASRGTRWRTVGAEQSNDGPVKDSELTAVNKTAEAQEVLDMFPSTVHTQPDRTTVKSRVLDPFTYKTTPRPSRKRPPLFFQPQNQYKALFLHFQENYFHLQILSLSESKPRPLLLKLLSLNVFFSMIVTILILKAINMYFSGKYFLFPYFNSTFMLP